MIFIPGNVPSLKNKKIMGKYLPVTVRKYLQLTGIAKYNCNPTKKKPKFVHEYKDPNRPNIFRLSIGDYFDGIEYPIVVWFHFVRNSKRRFDFNNAVQIIADLLTAHDFIVDDDMTHFIPYPMYMNGGWFTVDKNNPGVYIDLAKR